MPYTYSGNKYDIYSGVSRTEFDYKYPRGLNLDPTGELHNRLLSHLMLYGIRSSSVMNTRYPVWEAIEKKLTAYIDLSKAEEEVLQEDPRKPVSIVFPYSYAILETLVSYLCTRFMVDPIFGYEGMGPEDTGGAFLLEKLIALHCDKTQVALNLHTMFRDACAYGFGVVTPQWVTKYGKRFKVDGKGREQPEDFVRFEGNGLHNIDPTTYLCDPDVPIHDPQRGGYVGWVDRTNLIDLLAEEEQSKGDMFNVKYLLHSNTRTTRLFEARSGSANSRLRHNTISIGNDDHISCPVDVMNLYVKLIPSMWGLGSKESPEKWLFTVAGDSIIVRAQPLRLVHNMFPICVCAPDYNGYSPIAYSRIEVLQGMQDVMDWLFNSHMVNVRKALKALYVVDPYMINMNDLKNPADGGFIRLRHPAMGKGVKDAIMQLGVNDVTRQNIGDVQLLVSYMQSVGGIDNALLGTLRTKGPERLSAQEFQGTAQGALSRLERVAKIIGLQAMQPIGEIFAAHAQQFMTRSTWLKTVGEWPESIKNTFAIQDGRVLMEPQHINVAYDVKIRDGATQGGNFSQEWVQLYQIIAQNPILLQKFDVVRLFSYIAQNFGAKNVEDFILPETAQSMMMSTMPDEEVMRGAEAGNMVPISLPQAA